VNKLSHVRELMQNNSNPTPEKTTPYFSCKLSIPDSIHAYMPNIGLANIPHCFMEGISSVVAKPILPIYYVVNKSS
jgi:hypothetical protein